MVVLHYPAGVGARALVPDLALQVDCEVVGYCLFGGQVLPTIGVVDVDRPD